MAFHNKVPGYSQATISSFDSVPSLDYYPDCDPEDDDEYLKEILSVAADIPDQNTARAIELMMLLIQQVKVTAFKQIEIEVAKIKSDRLQGQSPRQSPVEQTCRTKAAVKPSMALSTEWEPLMKPAQCIGHAQTFDTLPVMTPSPHKQWRSSVGRTPSAAGVLLPASFPQCPGHARSFDSLPTMSPLIRTQLSGPVASTPSAAGVLLPAFPSRGGALFPEPPKPNTTLQLHDSVLAPNRLSPQKKAKDDHLQTAPSSLCALTEGLSDLPLWLQVNSTMPTQSTAASDCR